MARPRLVSVLAPGVLAGAGALVATAAEQPAAVIALAAVAGAVAGALLPLAGVQEDILRTEILPNPHKTSAPEADGAILDRALPAGLGRVLLEHMPVGFILIGRDRQVEFINSEARGFFGRNPSDRFHISALRAPRLLEAIDRVLRSGDTETVQFSLSRAQTIDLQAHLRGLTDAPVAQDMAEQAGVLIMIEDRTAARRAEMMHRDFVANASHELKTPLASISGIIETLQGHAKDDPEATERFLGLMSQQTGRMKHLVQDLLSLNRIEINERVHPRDPQPLALIVGEAASGLGALASGSGKRIAFTPPQERLVVLGHREELAQVFANLLENAIKYSRDDSQIDVEILSDPATRPEMIGVAVRDQGRGIPREHLPRLTERFYRVSVSRSREKGGTGLGLAIVKHIVNRHRGELEIQSVPDQGSVFTVWLPRAPAEQLAPASDSPRGAAAANPADDRESGTGASNG